MAPIQQLKENESGKQLSKLVWIAVVLMYVTFLITRKVKKGKN